MDNIPITIIFTDIHLKESNCQEIKNLLVNQGIKICKDNKIKQCFCLGDVFDSRISQKQIILSTWDNILDAYDKAGIELICIRGNHDSSDYTSSDSFLKPFKHYPNFRLIDDIDIVRIRKFLFGCIAYYDEDIWIERFDELVECIQDEKKGDDKLVCLGHIAITGSRNLGHVTENKLNLKMFKKFDMTFQGHFHDYQEVSETFVHLGSLTQNNFGEDENKGFWVLYDDLTYDLIPSEGKKFRKITIDLNSTTLKQVDKIVKMFKDENPGNLLRVEFKGNKDELSSIDKKTYQELGIDVKTKLDEVEIIDVETSEEVKALSSNDIVKRFKTFCDENDYNYNEGVEILEKAL